MAVGRISGPLLKANLLRNGVDLAFETDLLYLDVNNLRIGINTNEPTHDLTVLGTTRTVNLEATNQLTIGNIVATGSSITSSAPQLTLTATGADSVIYQKKILIDDLEIQNSSITATTPDTDISLQANGSGQIKIFSDLLVNGNLHATGTITADGSVIIGDSNTDNITFNADINSNIVPNTTELYDLGISGKRWKEAWVDTGYISDLNVDSTFLLDNIELSLRPGYTLFVSTSGNDTYSGTHQSDPFKSLKHALTVATSGTTIVIYPGTYSEIFPLTVPVGVTIKGTGVRSVVIQPTVATISNDAFLLNGETTIEDLTVSGFRYNSVANTGHAFRFATNILVSSRSPYIRNVSVITQGSVVTSGDPRGFNSADAGRGAYIDGSVANSASKEASMLFHSVTFITPGVDAITMRNGVRVEWLNSFTYFANRSLYALSGTTGFAGSATTQLRVENPTGTFNVGDTVTYYSTYPTAITSGVITAKSADGKLTLAGKVANLVTAQDRGGKVVTPHGDAKLSIFVRKFGSASLQLDGVGDYATVSTSPDWAFGTGDFTCEMWVYNTGNPNANQILLDFRTANPQVVPILYLQATTNTLRYAVNGNVVIETGVIPFNTWTHIALSKHTNQTRAFVNGTQAGVTYADTNDYIQGVVTIGARYDGTTPYFGYIDDLRISKGIGRYTTNFTAPVTAVSNDVYTKLLLKFNGTNGSTTFVDETFLTQDIRSSSGGASSKITLVDYSDFGAEVRSIASASVYGNYGAVGDGVGVKMYMIGHNFAYVGTGLRSDNDLTYVVQANETVESNGAKIFYSSVDQQGDFRIGDLFYVNQNDGTVTFTSANFNVNSGEGLTFVNGNNVTYIDGNQIDTGNLRLSGNTLSSTIGDINLTSATGAINLLNNVNVTGNLDVVGNVTIGGNIVIGDDVTDSISFVGGIDSNLIPKTNNTYDIGSPLIAWKDVYASNVFAGGLTLTGTTVTPTATNTNLTLQGNGTGTVIIEGVTVQDNTLTTTSNTDLVLAPNGTGVVNINTTSSMLVPVGTEGERPVTAQTGMIRFNTTANRYEGYNGTNWVYLDGLSDLDGNTKVTAELTPGANDNTIRFYNDGVVTADLTATRFNVPKVTVDDIEINGSTITNTAGGTLSLQAATGVIVENFSINGTVISNTVNNGVTTINSTGTGYVRILGSGGVVIPAGNTDARPSAPALGMIRFDTTAGRLEVFNGGEWISSAGTAVGVTRVEVEDFSVQYTLMLG